MASSQLCWPELIRARDWLPVARHEDSTEQQPVFENLDHTNWARSRHGVLRQRRTYPCGATGSVRLIVLCRLLQCDILWELWIEAFEKAVALRLAPGKHSSTATQNGSVMSGMLMLADMARKARGSEEPRCSNPRPRQDRGVCRHTH